MMVNGADVPILFTLLIFVRIVVSATAAMAMHGDKEARSPLRTLATVNICTLDTSWGVRAHVCRVLYSQNGCEGV
jgi:hypothetical protein